MVPGIPGCSRDTWREGCRSAGAGCLRRRGLARVRGSYVNRSASRTDASPLRLAQVRGGSSCDVSRLPAALVGQYPRRRLISAPHPPVFRPCVPPAGAAWLPPTLGANMPALVLVCIPNRGAPSALMEGLGAWLLGGAGVSVFEATVLLRAETRSLNSAACPEPWSVLVL